MTVQTVNSSVFIFSVESADRLEIKKEQQRIIVSKENIRPDEKYQDQTKFEIAFRTIKENTNR